MLREAIDRTNKRFTASPRDYERTPGASEAQVQISMIQLMLRRLAGQGDCAILGNLS